MVIHAANEIEEIHGGEKDNFGIIAKVGKAGPQVGETTDPVLLQADQQAAGGAEHAGIEVEVFGWANHVFWPISQFTYM
jgi:hypothetical protein